MAENRKYKRSLSTFAPVCVAAISLSVAVFSLLGICVAADVRPNIVLMLVDDMGVMDTSLPFLTDETGQAKRYPLNDFYRTPNMERLAALGARFRLLPLLP